MLWGYRSTTLYLSHHSYRKLTTLLVLPPLPLLYSITLAHSYRRLTILFTIHRARFL